MPAAPSGDKPPEYDLGFLGGQASRVRFGLPRGDKPPECDLRWSPSEGAPEARCLPGFWRVNTRQCADWLSRGT